MAKKLYVGNLSWGATEDGLRDLFSPFGEVLSVNIITDRETGRSRGFGFVEMENPEAAIAGLNEKEYEGRPLKVNEAQDKPRTGGGGGHGGRGGYGGGGGGRGGRDRW
ncbi:MAG: RNA-binding protein [Chitinispirillaceae bacterium]|nr:RNA-binding protein [Chitinispirillaceae bacterium]